MKLSKWNLKVKNGHPGQHISSQVKRDDFIETFLHTFQGQILLRNEL